MNLRAFHLDPNADAGLPAAAPVETPAPVSIAPTPGAEPVATPAPTPQPAAPSPAASTTRLIDTLPDSSTPEFREAYAALTAEQRAQLDTEDAAIRAGTAPARGQKPATAVEETKPAALPGDDKPAADTSAPTEPSEITNVDLETIEAAKNILTTLTPEQKAALPAGVVEALEAAQKTPAVIRWYDERYQKVAHFADPKVQEGLELWAKDPIMAQRQKELASGIPYTPPEKIVAEFNPSQHLPKDKLDAIHLAFAGNAEEGIDPDPAAAERLLGEFGDSVVRDIARRVETNVRAEAAFEIKREKTLGIISTKLLALEAAHPELKNTDPSVSDIWNDARHPLHALSRYVAATYRDSHFLNDPSGKAAESAYAGFLANTGALQKTMQGIATGARTSLLKNIERAQKDVATTVGRGSSPVVSVPTTAIPGVDMNRFNADATFRASAYQDAMVRGDLKTANLIEAADAALRKSTPIHA